MKLYFFIFLFLLSFVSLTPLSAGTDLVTKLKQGKLTKDIRIESKLSQRTKKNMISLGVDLKTKLFVTVFTTSDSFDKVKKALLSQGVKFEELDKEKEKNRIKKLQIPVNKEVQRISPLIVISYRVAQGRSELGEIVILESHQENAKTGKWMPKTTIRVIRPLIKK